jgi:hypothetical protein
MGVTTERVDTRVIEAIFEVVGTPRSRLYPGQAVDVFIEAGPGADGPKTGAPPTS